MAKHVKELLMCSETNPTLSKNESVAISYLRVFAILSIVTCHFLQAFGNVGAWILNVGVQIFFFISGYLYGHKEISEWPTWYLKRIKRVYIPYIIAVAIFLPFCIGSVSNLNAKIVSAICYLTDTQWFMGGVNGLNNLWFVSAIFICYLTTPLLQGLRRVAPIVLILILGYGVMEYTVIQHDIFIYEAPFIYSIGYMLANVRSKESNVVVALFLIIAVCIAFNIDEEHIKAFSGVQNRLLHLSAGVSLSYIFIKGIAKVQFIKTNRGIKLLDKYSYQIYLTHHPFILGPITLISISPWIPLNIIIILTITLVLSYLLTIITNKINSIIKL